MDELHFKDQAQRFKIDMDDIIRRHSTDLQQQLQSLYHRHLDFEAARKEPAAAGIVNPVFDKHDTGQAQTSKPDGTCKIVNPSSERAAELWSRATTGLSTSSDASISRSGNHRVRLFENHLDHERSSQLELAFSRSESLEAEANHRAKQPNELHSSKVHAHAEWWYTMTHMSPRDLFLELGMGIIIVLDIIVVGISMDFDPNSNSLGFLLVDIVMCCFFVAELALRLLADGLRKHFRGKDWRGNLFNLVLIVIDITDMVLAHSQVMSDSDAHNSGMPSASMARSVRLMRITRVLRALKFSVFSDLIAMMQGMLLGMTTLAWSMVLFLVCIYVFALLFRETLGRGPEDQLVAKMFTSVPRSFYTTFRCSFGDCSDGEGTPLFEHVEEYYGWSWKVVYCIFTYFISIGIFNVISAIFVEATMKSAEEMNLKSKLERLQSADLWSLHVSQLLRRLVRRHVPEPLVFFACTWEDHCICPLDERLEEVRERQEMSDISDAEWDERLFLEDSDGKSLCCSSDFGTISKESFPVIAKFRPPASFRNIDEISDNEAAVSSAPLSEDVDQISKLAYKGTTIDKWVKDPYVVDALDALDIDPQDHDRLSDILDPQNDGQVPVVDLVDGVRRLRGLPRRSDIVCIDLMVRQIQRKQHTNTDDLSRVEVALQHLQEAKVAKNDEKKAQKAERKAEKADIMREMQDMSNKHTKDIQSVERTMNEIKCLVQSLVSPARAPSRPPSPPPPPPSSPPPS